MLNFPTLHLHFGPPPNHLRDPLIPGQENRIIQRPVAVQQEPVNLPRVVTIVTILTLIATTITAIANTILRNAHPAMLA